MRQEVAFIHDEAVVEVDATAGSGSWDMARKQLVGDSGMSTVTVIVIAVDRHRRPWSPRASLPTTSSRDV